MKTATSPFASKELKEMVATRLDVSSRSHHRFDVDEASLEIGAEVLLRAAHRFLGA